ncbi:ChaB family protein [Undibacterium arcticum]|uniref:ChaB family protein n=1 Tax=Undibacterium arcticum TaxID=1762892 RepID=A0ABV7F7D9_9BURK
MPYKHPQDLPQSVRDNLPLHAQEIYQKSFNSAWHEYAGKEQRRDDESREETAHKVAWAAVKRSYHKDSETGKWEPNSAH